MTATAEQLRLDGTISLPGLVAVSAPAVEMRVLDPTRLAVGGHRATAIDRDGRRLAETHLPLTLTAACPTDPTELVLGAVVGLLTERMRRATPAPISTWSWRAYPGADQ